MKINIASPQTGLQKLIEIDDEKTLQQLYDRRMAQEVDGGILGEEFEGYVMRISGGNDKQGFPMKQGVLTNTRVRLLLTKGLSCYRPRRAGERKVSFSCLFVRRLLRGRALDLASTCLLENCCCC